jgi:hypothetical protein
MPYSQKVFGRRLNKNAWSVKIYSLKTSQNSVTLQMMMMMMMMMMRMMMMNSHGLGPIRSAPLDLEGALGFSKSQHPHG